MKLENNRFKFVLFLGLIFLFSTVLSGEASATNATSVVDKSQTINTGLVITLGEATNSNQIYRKAVMSYFQSKTSKNVNNAAIKVITASEVNENGFGGRMYKSNQIFSCAMIDQSYTNGLKVVVSGHIYDNPGMYEDALRSNGITNASVVVTSPTLFYVTGDSALTGIILDKPPVVSLVKAKMLSPNELGLGVKVDKSAIWSNTISQIEFSGNINGESISRVFDISKYFSNNKATIGLDADNNVISDTPLKIDLKELDIPRITKNIQFKIKTVMGTGYQLSREKQTDVEIFLPVILVHGFNSNPTCWDNMIKNYEKQGITYYTFDYANGLNDPFYVSKDMFTPWFNKMYTGSIYGKFNIVCHSMGALVTRYWLQGMTENNGNTNAKYVNKWIGIAPVISGAAIMDVWYDPKNPKYSHITDNKFYMALLRVINRIIPMNSAAAKSMQTTNPLIIKLNQKALPSNVKYYVIEGYDGYEIPGIPTVEKPSNNQPYIFTTNGDGVVANQQSTLTGVNTLKIKGINHTELPSNTQAIIATINYVKS